MLPCLISPLARSLRRSCSFSCRSFSTGRSLNQEKESKPEQEKENKVSAESESDNYSLSRRDYRFIFPEFLPDPNPAWRNAVRERLERKDMLNRREQIEIPGNPSTSFWNQPRTSCKVWPNFENNNTSF